MSATTTARAVRVLESFGTLVQDLGRVGHEALGINRSGASDIFSARAANLLLGNPADAALLEITDSGFRFEAEQEVIIAVTGAEAAVLLDGDIRPGSWRPVRVPAGRTLSIAPPTVGYRVYLAFAGGVSAERLLDSVSPLPPRGFANAVATGDRLLLGEPAAAVSSGRIDARQVRRLLAPGAIGVLQTAQARVFDGMESLYANAFTMSARSNAVGARLNGDTPVRRDKTEITSRSVPIGSIEIPSEGELIALLRGRLITAGYPIPAVIARADIDAIAQVRPGEQVRFERIDETEARWRILHQETALRRLTETRGN